MYDIADDNLQNDIFKEDSDEDIQILEEKLVKLPSSDIADFSSVINCFIRASVISGQKRTAAMPLRSPREANGFKRLALQDTDDEDEWSTSETSPVPTTSQNLVQSSTITPGHLSTVGQSNRPLPQVPGCSMYQSHSCSMNQPIQSCMSIPSNGPQCAHSSSVQNCLFPMWGCNSLARPIPMRPSDLTFSSYPAQSSCNSGELSVSNRLNTSPSQLSLPPQQSHDCSTLPSQSSNQPFQTCLSSPYIITHASSLLNSHLIASTSCSIPVNSTLPPQMNYFQEAYEQPQSSSQASNISSVAQLSQESTNVSGENSPIHEGQIALDLSSPMHSQLPRSTFKEKRKIWQGTLHYEEKAAIPSDPNVSHYLGCSFSALLDANGGSDLDVDVWPSQMQLSLIASEILKEKNMFEVLKVASHHLVINFHGESQVLKRIKRNMNRGWMGCVQFTIPNDVRIFIILYMPQKKVYIGFIPHEQKIFFNTFRHVYEKKRRIRNIQKQLQAGTLVSGSQPASSSVSTSMGLNEESRNQFEEIDNEIDAHILAHWQKHQEAQPSTSYQQPGPSCSTNNQSIEARLKRLETAQKGNTRNINEYEDIDNDINAKIAAHWTRHYSQDIPPSTSQQTRVSYPPANISFTSSSSQSVVDESKKFESTHETSWPVQLTLTSSTFKPHLYAKRHPGGVSIGTLAASLLLQSAQGTPPSVDENSVESQASEIFGKDLVQKVVQKQLTETGKRFCTIQELCDEILRHEESRPKHVEEKSKKDVSEEMLCKICLDQGLSMLFEPCKHLATCQECAQPLTKCPICRTAVKKKTRIYMS